MLEQTRQVSDDPRVAEPVGDSVLDRRIDITRVSGASLAWLAILLVAAATRLIQRTTWPLSAAEAQVASDALAIVQGGDLSPHAAAHPLATHLVALALFLFGASDTSVRITPAVVGIVAVALLWSLRGWLGPRVALAAAAIVAISPTLAFAGRRADAGAELVLTSLAFLAALIRYETRPGGGGALLVGAAGGLLLLSGPLGWVALALLVLARPSGVRALGRSGAALPLVGIGLLGAPALIATSLFSRPAGFADFLAESLGDLWALHLRPLGEDWFLGLAQVVVDELFALVLAAASGVLVLRRARASADERPAAAAGLLRWGAAGVLAAILLGGKSAELYTLAALPLALLAGVGLAALVDRVDWPTLRTGTGILFVVTLLLAVAAAGSTFGLLSGGPGSEAAAWLLSLIIVGLLILAPLVALTLWLARHLSVPVWPAVALLGVLFLAGLSLRSSVLLGATNLTRPGEPLLVGSTTPDVEVLVEEITRLSRDVTTFTADPRDPTGGHGLTIVVDGAVSQPFAWYFREFPNLRVIGTGQLPPDLTAPDVVIAQPGAAWSLIPDAAAYDRRDYALALTQPAALTSPDAGHLLRTAITPSGWRRFVEFLVDRDVATPAEPATFTLGLRQDLALRFYGQTQP